MSNVLIDELTIYSKGVVHCSVCARKGMTHKQIEEKVNEQNPTGIKSRWKISKEKFADGSSNPNQCSDHEDRRHYLMVC